MCAATARVIHLFEESQAPQVQITKFLNSDSDRCREGAARLQRGMRYAPDMPELRKDPAAAGMHGLGHLPPSLDLGVIVDARREGIASALRRNVGPLGDDEPGRGALRVIFGH